ncbi:protein of unknown function DUF4050 [Dillenia turbinata]|uniref:Gag1-like clamp domain-containing protein n=1 Tax=Dillenia turbinata TaxID=194707 RepID=A0AAN8ZM04_9MAGN
MGFSGIVLLSKYFVTGKRQWSSFLDAMETNGSNSHSHEKCNSGHVKTEVEDKKSSEQGIHGTGFVNHAEIAWHERRKEWVGDQSQKPRRLPGDPVMRHSCDWPLVGKVFFTSEPFWVT